MTESSLGETTLLNAFRAYEFALINDDITVLNESFSAREPVIRCDHNDVLVGHEVIGKFRNSRGGIAPRVLRALYLREISGDAAMLVAESERRDGTFSIQTQLWQREGEQWRIGGAHVGQRPAARLRSSVPQPDPTVWRVRPEDGPLLSGASGGPLAGLGVAVKDLFAISGQRVGAGNPLWLAQASIEARNAECVSALIAAGADIVGIAHTDELAFSLAGTNRHYGSPPNPAAPGRIVGGSTSGPASAVADGSCDIGLGTDTAGSIRVPASYCGLYGLRTTHDTVSRDGLVGLAESFDTVGLLARDPASLTATASVLLGSAPPPLSVPQAPARQRILLSPELFALAEPAVAIASIATLRAHVVRRNATVETISIARERLEEWFAAFRTVQQAEAWKLHGDFVTANRDSLDPAIAQRFDLGQATAVADVADARAVLARARTELETFLRCGAFLALPATSSPAPSIDAAPDQIDRTRAATLRLTALASLAGLPQLVTPGARADGLPVGLGLIAAAGNDRSLLEFLDE